MTQYNLTGLASAPEIFRRLIAVIPPTRLDEQLDPERFTPREVIAHLADWEPILRSRLQAALDSDEPEIVPYDEGVRAADQNYASWSISDSLTRFGEERRLTVQLLSGLSPEQGQRRFKHPELGSFSILAYAAGMNGHDTYHVEQLTHYLGPKEAGTW